MILKKKYLRYGSIVLNLMCSVDIVYMILKV